MTTPTTPSWQFSIALFMALGGRVLRFLKQPSPQVSGQTTTTETYSGETLPGGSPIDLTVLANRVLSNFDLSLPDAIPDICFDNVSGSITRTTITDPQGKQPPTIQGTYQFSASSTTLATRPFGEHIPVAAFNNFNLQLASATNTSSACLFLQTTISFDKSITFLSNGLQGTVVLASSASVIGFQISNTLSTAQIIGQLLDLDIADEVKDFLPDFAPLSEKQPIRFYQATNTVSVTDASGTVSAYQQGFNLDQVVIGVLGQQFSLVLNRNNGFTIGAALDSLNLGIVVLNNPKHLTTTVPNPGLGGPLIQIVNQTSPASTSLTLAAELVFFDTISFDLSASYITNSKSFTGTVQYNGDILGIHNPQLQIAWSKEDGFQIRSFPIPDNELSQFIDFAKEIKNIVNSNPGDCGPLGNFAFSKIITTTFDIHVKPEMVDGSPHLILNGTYNIYVAGYAIEGIDFELDAIKISIPKGFDDLGNAIIKTITGSAAALVQSLYDNRAKLVALLGAVALQQGAQEAAQNFICRFGKKELQDLVDEAADSAASAASTGAAAGMDTLAAAAGVFTAAVATLSIFAKIADCLDPDQKKQRDKAKQQRQAAQDRINALLQINNLAVRCTYDNQTLALAISWGSLSEPNNSTLDVSVTNSAGTVVFQQNGLNGNTTDINVVLAACDTYTISVNGEYVYQGYNFTGNAATSSITVPRLVANTPTATYSSEQNQISISWSASGLIFLPGTLITITADHYLVQMQDQTLQQAVPGMSATIAANQPLQASFDLLPSTAPFFWPQPTHQYAITLTAVASNTLFNSTTASVSLPALAAGIGHTRLGMTFKLS